MDNEQRIIVSIDGDASGLDNTVKSAAASLDTLGNNKGTKSLKQELRELTNSAQQLLLANQQNTQGYRDMADRIAELKDAQDVFNRTIPDAGNQLAGVSRAASIVSGTISGLSPVFKSVFPDAGGLVDGLVASLGTLSAALSITDTIDDSIDILLPYIEGLRAAAVAQNAVAVAEGATTAVRKTGTVALLAQAAATKVATAAQTALNFVLNLSPFTLIATAVATLVVGFITFKDSITNLIPGLKGLSNGLSSAYEFFTDLVGITSDASRASDAYSESLKRVNGDLEYQNRILATRSGTERQQYENSRKILSNQITDIQLKRKAEGKATTEQIADLNKAIQDRNVLDAKESKRLQDVMKKRSDDQAKHDKDIADKAKAKAEASAKEAKAKRDADLKTISDNLKAAQLIIDENGKSETEKAIATIQRKYKTEIDLANKYGKDTLQLQAAQAAEEDALRQKNQEETAEKLKAANEKAVADKIAHHQALADAEILEVENSNTVNPTDSPEVAAGKIFAIETAKLNVLQSTFELKKETLTGQNEELRLLAATHEADIIALNQDSSDKIKAIKQAEFENKMNIQSAELDAAGQFGNVLGQIAGKNKTLAIAGVIVEQAAAVGKIAMNTGVANAKAVAASPLTGGQPWVTINTVTGALGAASALLSAKNAISQINATAGSGGGSAGGIGSAPSVSANSAPVINSTALQPQTVQDVRNVTDNSTTAEAKPVRAYIVANDLDEKAKEDAFTDSFSKV